MVDPEQVRREAGEQALAAIDAFNEQDKKIRRTDWLLLGVSVIASALAVWRIPIVEDWIVYVWMPVLVASGFTFGAIFVSWRFWRSSRLGLEAEAERIRDELEIE